MLKDVLMKYFFTFQLNFCLYYINIGLNIGLFLFILSIIPIKPSYYL